MSCIAGLYVRDPVDMNQAGKARGTPEAFGVWVVSGTLGKELFSEEERAG